MAEINKNVKVGKTSVGKSPWHALRIVIFLKTGKLKPASE
jgi:hypothetical protein